MKLLIIYPPITIPPLTDQRPFPLLLAGGNTLLGHAITLAGERVTELIVVTDQHQDQITAWLAERYPALPARVVATGALSLTGELLVYNGAAVTNASFAELASTTTTAVSIGDEATTIPGAIWLPDAAALPDFHWPDLFAVGKGTALLETAVVRREAIFHFPVTDQISLFYANKRLLGLGYGSEDAVERSYAEDFTVFPPVFLHETAVVAGCVIGPYVTIDAGVTLRNTIVADSIIEVDARVENMILRDSYLGPGSQASGSVETIVTAADVDIN